MHPIDPGLIPIYERVGRDNLGHSLETAVLIELIGRGCEVHYFRTPQGNEIDFHAVDARGSTLLVQVCTNAIDPATLDREIRSLIERWHLHNELFGDDVRFLGVLPTDSGLRLLIRQPAIAGTPATDEEIQRFFTESGWERFVMEGNTAYFDPERCVAISDTHRGNIVLMEDGLLAPIDLRVQLLTGSPPQLMTKTN